jgi:hypothetical protein
VECSDRSLVPDRLLEACELEPSMSDDETLHAALKNSAEMKDEGNAFFMAKNWTSAITAYNQALACLPSHIPVVVTTTETTKTSTNDEGDQQGPPNNGADAAHIKASNRDVDSMLEEGSFNSSKQPVQSHKITQMEEACSHARVVLHSNIAACELKMVRVTPLQFFIHSRYPLHVAVIGSLGSRGQGCHCSP